MTPEQVIAVADKYIEDLGSKGVSPQRDGESETNLERLHHASWMCFEIRRFVAAGKIEKAMRWLGFVQGVLWTTETMTLEEMKDDNR